MKKLLVAALLSVCSSFAHADTVERDVVSAPSGGLTFSDFSYSHAAVSGTIVRATLGLTAFDIDADETVTIYANNNASLMTLGVLTPTANNRIGQTFFVLPSTLYDDIASGLSILVTVTGGSSSFGAFALTRSALTTVVASVPEPSTWALFGLGAGLLGFAALRRRRMEVLPLAA